MQSIECTLRRGWAYKSVGCAGSSPLVMLRRLIWCMMWSVLSRGPSAAARAVNCSMSRLFSRSSPHTSSLWEETIVRDECSQISRAGHLEFAVLKIASRPIRIIYLWVRPFKIAYPKSNSLNRYCNNLKICR